MKSVSSSCRKCLINASGRNTGTSSLPLQSLKARLAAALRICILNINKPQSTWFKRFSASIKSQSVSEPNTVCADDTSSVQLGLLMLANRLDWAPGCSSCKLLLFLLLLLPRLLFLVLWVLLAIPWLAQMPRVSFSIAARFYFSMHIIFENWILAFWGNSVPLALSSDPIQGFILILQ